MPYIMAKRRAEILAHKTPHGPGELNYAFTEIIKTYLATFGESYQVYNDIVGALECCKLELYRRKIVPYEDVKIVTNGDAY